MSDESITAVQYGVGPIGGRIVRAAVKRGIEYVGAIDIDPEKVGADLGDVAETDSLGVQITDDTEAALDRSPDVVLHTTHSSLSVVQPQLEEAMVAGADVVSTTESLSYPWWHEEKIADELDRTAREHDATCLGTGINPGFVMDTLPAVLSTPCQAVDSVRVERVQDAGSRRIPLQEKVGAGATVDEFEAEIASKAGHVGLPESVAMLADALGWPLEEIDERIEPVVADESVEADVGHIFAGNVAGIKQSAHGFVDGNAVIELDLQMYVGAQNPRDHVSFTGEPDLDVLVEGGIHGDVGTGAVVTNVVDRVLEADAGLKTMIDLPIPSFSH